MRWGREGLASLAALKHPPQRKVRRAPQKRSRSASSGRRAPTFRRQEGKGSPSPASDETRLTALRSAPGAGFFPQVAPVAKRGAAQKKRRAPSPERARRLPQSRVGGGLRIGLGCQRPTVKRLETPRTVFNAMKAIRMNSTTPMMSLPFCPPGPSSAADREKVRTGPFGRCDGRHRSARFGEFRLTVSADERLRAPEISFASMAWAQAWRPQPPGSGFVRRAVFCACGGSGPQRRPAGGRSGGAKARTGRPARPELPVRPYRSCRGRHRE